MGIKIVGFTKWDLNNCLQTKKMKSLKYDEVDVMITYSKQESENPSFFMTFNGCWRDDKTYI